MPLRTLDFESSVSAIPPLRPTSGALGIFSLSGTAEGNLLQVRANVGIVTTI